MSLYKIALINLLLISQCFANDLNGNSLELLRNSKTFGGLKNLKYLYLENNKISSIRDGLFDGISCLTSFNFANNNCYINTKTVAGCIKLDTTNCSLIHVDTTLAYTTSTTSTTTRSTTPSTTTTTTTQAPSTTTTTTTTTSTPTITTIPTTVTTTTATPTTVTTTTATPSTVTTTLPITSLIPTHVNYDILVSWGFKFDETVVDLSNRNIGSIEGSLFQRFTNLERLILKNNKLLILYQNTFKGLVKLKYLDLSYNRLTGIDADTLSGADNLDTIFLNNNNIQSINLNAFNNMLHVTNYDFSFNPIASIYSIILSNGVLTLRPISG